MLFNSNSSAPCASYVLLIGSHQYNLPAKHMTVYRQRAASIIQNLLTRGTDSSHFKFSLGRQEETISFTLSLRDGVDAGGVADIIGRGYCERRSYYRRFVWKGLTRYSRNRQILFCVS